MKKTFLGIVGAFRFAIATTPFFFFLAVCLTVVTGLALPAQVYLVGITVSQFEGGQRGSMLALPMVALAGTYGIAAAISTFRQVGSEHLGWRISVEAQGCLLESFGRLDVEDVIDSDVRKRLDIAWGTARERLGSFVSGAVGWASTAVSSLGVFAVLWAISPVIAALVGLASLGPVITTPYLLRAYNISLQQSAPADREVSVGAVYIVSSQGFRDLKGSGSYRLMSEQLIGSLWRSARIHLAFINRQGVAGVFLFGWAIVALSLAMLIMANSGFSAADIAATLSAMTALNSLIAVFVTGGTLVQQLPFVADLFDALKNGFEVDAHRGGGDQPAAGGKDGRKALIPGPLEARGLTFSYSASPAVLDGIDLAFFPGTITALVGRNGEGKTTLMRVLQGAYRPASGTLHYGPHDITNSLTSLVGTLTHSVQQDVPRPPLTVRDYLTCGKDVDAPRFRDALEHAGVDFLSEERLARRIGAELEDGTDFSGGQWQKLAIARLLLSDAPIWLLDEPASALDPESELELMTSLRRVMGSRRIVVIVSHRLSTVLQADSYALVAGGRISEAGDPRAASAREGSALRRLFAAQITS